MKQYFVYILASKKYGTVYIGITDDLTRRIVEHKNDLVEGFTKKYQIHALVYLEQCKNVEEAIIREKRLKTWKRKWKIELINKINPEWRDLYQDIM